VLPDSDPINPVDRVPELGSKPTLPLTPPATLVTGEANPTTAPGTGAEATDCTPTRADAEGPFYEPNAPERTSIGKGHVLKGVVRSSAGCQPIPGAQLEFWQVNDRAEYDDDHRATMFSDSSGAYSFESNYPQPYSGRPSHIHLRVTADGYQTLTTQFYPQQGETEATFDIVLVED
jgi:protocatechuate 3,4-dioxygenase beta subunit